MTQIILFPGFDQPITTWSTDGDKKIRFLSKLKKIGLPIMKIDIPWTALINIETFVATIQTKPKSRYILVAHSIGFIFAYYFAKLHKKQTQLIVSIDGSYIGAPSLEARAMISQPPPPPLMHLIEQIPTDVTKMPVKTVCFRNLRIEDRQLKKYIPEEFGHFKLWYYVNRGHYLYRDSEVADDIIRIIREL